MGFAQIEGIAVFPIWLILSPEEKALFNRHSSSEYHSFQQSWCSVKYMGNNGCDGNRCIGYNANYKSDDLMGYLFGSVSI